MASSNSAKRDLARKDTEELLSMPIGELLGYLGTSESGLNSEEVQKRLELYGFNELAERKKRMILTEFLLRLKSPLVITLLLAGLISGFVGEVTDAVLIFVIVLLSGILDFYQEFKAEKAAEMLKERVTTTATVLRDGAKREVKLTEIVPGDIVHLSAGDIVPADARAIIAKDLFADQSALTGESFPVEKTVAPLQVRNAAITEWNNCLFMGTSIVGGSGIAVVLKTGSLTEYGRIAKRLVTRQPEKEFERGLRRFGFMITQVAFVLVAFVFLINAMYKRDVLESLLFAAALAVGLVPELLPMMLSVNLSKGALAMSRKGVIVKRLASIQNLGSMDILCTDKTGTLTENKITLGPHVNPTGKDDEKVFLHCYLNSYFQTGLKSPLDEAVLRHGELNAKEYVKIDEVPFDFARRRVSVVVERNGQRLLISKGAPEEVLRICTRYEYEGRQVELDDRVYLNIQQLYDDLGHQGLRVLGVAYKQVNNDKQNYSANDEREMTFLGFVAFTDPPKEDAKESIQLLEKSGIELKILTGDNEIVTRHLCEQLGFKIKGVVLGSEIAHLHDEALSRVVEQANVFARVTPTQKDRIMNALRMNGHVVGFLGDGINDAPSMKTADVAISVDNAVDIAKESADMILLQKSLRVLHDGVLEGRKTFGNTMKYVLMGTSSSFGNMFSVAGASLFLPFLPMLPIQILLNNLLYESSQAALPTDDVDNEYVEKPKRWNVSFVRRFMIVFGPISSIFDFMTFFIMLYAFNATEPLFQTAWFIESLTTQTLVIFIIRTRRVPFYKSKPGRIVTLSSLTAVAIALLIPFTPLGTLFQFVPLPRAFLVLLGALVSTYLVLVEVTKKWFYTRFAETTEDMHGPRNRVGIRLDRRTRLVQDIVAVVCLHPDAEITLDSLYDDLTRSVSYQTSREQVFRSLQYLRRAGLVSIKPGTVTRQETAMRNYVANVVAKQFLQAVAEDWKRTAAAIEAKYHRLNSEYQSVVNLQSPSPQEPA
jgi:Mg2+-importing ATPase